MLLTLLRKLFGLQELHPVLRKNAVLFAEFDQGRPLDEYSFTVFDTELTGLHRRKDQLIAIGAVRIEQLQIAPSHCFHSHVRPDKIQPNLATLIHRITPEQLAQAPPLEEVLPAFVEFCGKSLLVGHFVDLDMHFLSKAAKKTLGGSLANPSIDTMRLARRYQEAGSKDFYGSTDQSMPCNLDALTESFNLPRFKPHDALEDALQTAYLFLYLVKKFRQGGIATLKDLYRAGRSGRL
ncbi:DNA-directed DNA polymerase [Candidatus Electronema halotolerans]